MGRIIVEQAIQKTLIQVGERVRGNYPEGNPLVYEFKKEPSAKDVSGIPDRLNYPDTYTGLNLNYIEALKEHGGILMMLDLIN